MIPQPATARPVISLPCALPQSLDTPLEVRIGDVETATGRRQVFGAVAKTDTDLGALIRHSLDAVGRTECVLLRRRVLFDPDHGKPAAA